jgi:carboxyl-terminal processing protease
LDSQNAQPLLAGFERLQYNAIMNREKLAWTASVLLLVVLAFQIPGTLAQRDDDYAFVRTLVDIHRRVADNYVDPVDESKLNQGAIDGMLGQLDPFSVYVPPAREEDFDRMLTGTFKGVGIKLDQHPDGTIEIVTPVDGSPAARSGIEPGDLLLAVDDHVLDKVRLIDLIKMIGGKIGSTVKLTVRHYDGKVESFTLTREEVREPIVKGYQRKADNTWDYYICDDPKVAYVQLTQFTGDSYKDLRAAIEAQLATGMRGLILDLRFNPGGQLDQAEQIINMLVPRGRTIVTTRGRSRPEQRRVSDGENVLPNFPMIVLVNEHSASAAEIVSGSLMDNKRAVVLGERSYGKGSVQEVIPLDEQGGELKLTVAYYYLPSGRLVHKRPGATDWGVQPQIYVPMDLATQEKVLLEREQQDTFRRPLPKTVTRPSTAEASTQPVAEPLDDVQLQAAINTMLGVLVFETHPPVVNGMPVSTTQATSAPSK